MVWGREPTDTIERPARTFFKFFFGLPRCTPNYFLWTELGIDDVANIVKKRNLAYLHKVIRMEHSRLPNIILAELKEDNYDFLTERGREIRRAGESGRLNHMRRARGQTNRGGARLLYQTLEYGALVDSYRKGNGRSHEQFIKARLELLQGLGYAPYIRNEPNCPRCGEPTRDDTVHYIGKCNFMSVVRRTKLGKDKLDLEEIRAILNNHNLLENITQYLTDYRELSDAMSRIQES